METVPQPARLPATDGAAAAVHPGVAAIANADPVAFAARLAHDVVFHSPAARFSFRGKEIASALFEAMVHESDPEQWRVLDFWDLGDKHVMAFSTCIGGRQVDLMNVVRLDERGQICDLTVYARPMAAISVFPAFVFPRLVGRYRGRLRTALVWLLCRPLPTILELGVVAILRLGSPPGTDFDA